MHRRVIIRSPGRVLASHSRPPPSASLTNQFKPARKVRQIQDQHAWVDGSQTGIPISEVTVAEPPAPIPVAKLTTPAKSTPSDKESDGNEISVLVTPQGRLQISADLDVKGIGKLKQMLEQYEQILKLLW
jgi:hypothetical protein